MNKLTCKDCEYHGREECVVLYPNPNLDDYGGCDKHKPKSEKEVQNGIKYKKI